MASLEPNPFQPRSAMDPTRLAELAASIRESGIVQPIRCVATATATRSSPASAAGAPPSRPPA